MSENNKELTPKGYVKKTGRNIGIDNVRTDRFRFKVNAQEKKNIIAKFEASELSDMSKYLRESAMKLSLVVVKNKEIDTKLRNEIRRIGVNLNQSARALNAKKDNTIPQNFKTQLDELTDICYKIMEQLK